MKRITAFILSAVMALSLFACRRGTDGGTTASESTVPETTSGSGQDTPAPHGASENNTNMLSTYGRVAYADGYTYFVSEGMLGNAKLTGEFDTDDIYRIKDGEETATLLLSLPRHLYDGISQTTVFGLIPYGENLYFEMTDGIGIGKGTSLYRLDMRSGEYSPVISGSNRKSRANSYNISDGKLYKQKVNVTEDGMTHEYFQVDLATGGVSRFEPDLGTTEPTEIICVEDGYVYFFKLGGEYEEPFGIFRTPLSGGKCEDVVPITVGIHGAYVTQGRVLIVEEEKDDRIQVYDVKTGERIGELVLDEDKPFNICGDTVYYIKGDSELCAMNIDGTGEHTVVAGREGFDVMLLGVCKDHFILLDNDLLVYRMEKTGRILPGNPIVKAVERPEDKTDENGFVYREWENAVEIVGYTGTEKTVNIPKVINHKEVTKVELFNVGESAAEKIVIPEGVYSAVIYSSRTVREVELPRSLGHMNYRGFPYSFECAEGCVFKYNGTMAQWQSLYDFCREYHDCSVDTYGTRSPVVQCTDGVWELPENN